MITVICSLLALILLIFLLFMLGICGLFVLSLCLLDGISFLGARRVILEELVAVALLDGGYYDVELGGPVHVDAGARGPGLDVEVGLVGLLVLEDGLDHLLEVGHLAGLLLGLLGLLAVDALQQQDLVHALQEPPLVGHLGRYRIQASLRIVQVLLREVQVVLQDLLQVQLLYEDEQKQWSFLLGLHLVPSHERVVENIDLQVPQFVDGHGIAVEVGEKLHHLLLQSGDLVLVLLP